jgi:DtxR family Mn-dependent transcriptional regulator
MVKALAESASPSAHRGVRLTSGRKRSSRHHRLVELFLVQVMGMSWDEVHDEAEQLEHVVSRLIERIDEMLGGRSTIARRRRVRGTMRAAIG